MSDPAGRVSSLLLWTLVAFCLAGQVACQYLPEPDSATDVPPKLVVVLVVDQLRGDFDTMYAESLADSGGLSTFLADGTVFKNAFYSHAVTLTAPGHATISTGANPAIHGIVGNDWHDPDTGKRIIVIQDDAESLVGSVIEGSGTSPRNLRAPTVGDELIVSTDGAAKVIGISGKDRGAILTAGHRGDAYWFSTDDGRFISSTYYGILALPDWVQVFNERLSGRWPQEWALDDPHQSFQHEDDRSFELGPWGMGNTFPHPFPNAQNKDYFEAIKRSPHIDDITLDLAFLSITEERLGVDNSPDLLFVSLSGNDYVNHAFGIHSVEAEENVRHLNQSMGDFMARVQTLLGRQNVMFVLTSDHGGDAIPEFRASLRGDGHRLIPPEMLDLANTALAKHFGIDGHLLSAFLIPNIYLDRRAIEAHGLDFAAVLSVTIEHFQQQPGVLFAVDTSSINLPLHWSNLVRRSLDHERSGDIFLMQTHSAFLGWPTYTATHGSAHYHDRHAALIFYRPGAPSRVVTNSVDMTAIAPTIATCLGVPIPAYAVSTPLTGLCD